MAINLGLLEAAGVAFLGGFLGGFASTMSLSAAVSAGAGAAAVTLGYGGISAHLSSPKGSTGGA